MLRVHMANETRSDAERHELMSKLREQLEKLREESYKIRQDLRMEVSPTVPWSLCLSLKPYLFSPAGASSHRVRL